MSSSPIAKVAFLLGSGISAPAGMPSTHDITEQVLSRQVYPALEPNFCGGPNVLYMAPSFEKDVVPVLVTFLQKLKEELIDPYYRNVARLHDELAESHSRDTRISEHYKMLHAHYATLSANYEDLLYVAEQIRDCLVGEYGNPAVQPLIDKMLPDIPQPLPQGWQFHNLAAEAAYYVEYIVTCLLSREPKYLDHLKALIDACLDDQFSRVDMFTLNHDTVLEQRLVHGAVKVTDGFGKPQNEDRYWNPDTFESESCKVRLFKLHGSVNWFQNRKNKRFYVPLEWDIWHNSGNLNKRRRWPNDDRRVILAGTFNKMPRYADPPYVDLHWRFYRYLGGAERLVLCGYGFGDIGINKRIAEWIETSPNHRATIVHPSRNDLVSAARYLISSSLDRWKREGKLSIIEKPIEDTSWKDIKGAF